MFPRISACAAFVYIAWSAGPLHAATIDVSAAEAQKVLSFLARADIKGVEAPDLMAFAAKMQAVVNPPAPPQEH